MEWNEIEEKHKKQWEDFKVRKIEEWDKIIKSEKEQMAAFSSEDRVPMSVYQNISQAKERWVELWGENGHRAKYLLALQINDRNKLKPFIKEQRLQKMRQTREEKNQKRKDRERDD